MKRRETILSLLLALSLLTGCLRDDYGDCLYITFDTLNPKHVYTEEVEHVSLYFYDGNGDLVRDYHYGRNQLRRSDMGAIVPDLPAGSYKVVAIVNDGIHTTTEGHTNYSTLTTRLNGGTLGSELPPIFIAEKEFATDTAPQIQTERMTLRKLNNNIVVHLLYDNDREPGPGEEFAPYAPTDGTNLTARVEGTNGRYHHELVGGSTKLTAYPWHRIDNGDPHYLPEHPARFTLSTMDFRHDGKLTLYLSETLTARSSTDIEVRHISLDIANYLRQAQQALGVVYATDGEFQQYLDFEDEFHIHVRLGSMVEIFLPPDICIEVLGWDKVSGGIDV